VGIPGAASYENAIAHCLLDPGRRRHRVVVDTADKLSNALGINAGGNELGHNQQGTQGGSAAFVLHALQVPGRLSFFSLCERGGRELAGPRFIFNGDIKTRPPHPR
jgi:hypothetical protein